MQAPLFVKREVFYLMKFVLYGGSCGVYDGALGCMRGPCISIFGQKIMSFMRHTEDLLLKTVLLKLRCTTENGQINSEYN